MQLRWVAQRFIEPTHLELLTDTNALLEVLKAEGNQVRVTVAAEDPMLNVLLQNQFAADNISCLDISAASRIPDSLTVFLNNFNDNPRAALAAGRGQERGDSPGTDAGLAARRGHCG